MTSFEEASLPRLLAWTAAALDLECPGAEEWPGAEAIFDFTGADPVPAEVGGAGALAVGDESMGVGSGAGAGADSPPLVPLPTPPGAVCGESPAGELAWTPPLPANPAPLPAALPPAWRWAGTAAGAGEAAARADANAAGLRLRSAGFALETDSLSDGPSGSGAGSSSGHPGWAKIATRARPAAAVIPSKAKAVLRILSGSPLPAKLGKRREARVRL
ncbi:MAG TPA: hypothetical protein VF009_11650 [Solirubrobacterales bacterium]